MTKRNSDATVIAQFQCSDIDFMNQDNNKKTIAVFFGSRSVEHDVSILTGIHVLSALDTTQFVPLSVYIAPDGAWYIGDALNDRHNYPISDDIKKQLTQVELAFDSQNSNCPMGKLRSLKTGLLKKEVFTYFDLAIPAIHGTNGEDGSLQGLFEIAGVPYAGSRVLASAIYMNKHASKHIFKANDVPHLPFKLAARDTSTPLPEIVEDLRATGIDYPVCVKPQNLGSSIGVSCASNDQQLETSIADVFKADNTAIIEPFVANLVEYNVAVTRTFGEIRFSAIEKPLRRSDTLDFSDKYRSADDMDSKLYGPMGGGLASATREFNPSELNDGRADNIRLWSAAVFDAVNTRGSVRFDFLCDSVTKELWMNEVNTIPGSMAFYLWEAAEPPVTFTQLLTAMVEEGFQQSAQNYSAIGADEMGGGLFQAA